MIFPYLAAHNQQNSAVWPEFKLHQNSPVRQTVFQEDATEPALISQPHEPGYSPVSPVVSGTETCPDCGLPLDQYSSDNCEGCFCPGRRLCAWLRCGCIGRGLFGPAAKREPWMDRPFSAGVFIGPIVGSPLIDDWVGQQTGTLAGMRLGWDFDDDWGLETRIASANIPLYDSDQAILAAAQGSSAPQYVLAGTRSSDHFIWDIEILYYPWGDARCRPYVLFGLGTDRIKFVDRLYANYARILAGMPLGLGVKTRLNDWMVFRIEFTDNVAFAGGSIFETQHNTSLTGALEVRLGRPRRTYWPWNTGNN